MKKNLLFLAVSFAFTTAALTQTTTAQNCCEPTPYIEVTGSAEMEIIPDEIYITIVLQEWYDGKAKITIEKMEADMFAALKTLNIDPKNISLSDAASNFYYRWLKSDETLLSRTYNIMVSTAEMVVKVYDEMGKIRASNAYISKISHSKIEEFRMQTKVNATIAAKEKAAKMIKAIGGEIGSAIIIKEIEEPVYQPYQYSQISNVMIMEDAGGTMDEYQSQVNYQKIKIRYEVFGKFEIL